MVLSTSAQFHCRRGHATQRSQMNARALTCDVPPSPSSNVCAHARDALGRGGGWEGWAGSHAHVPSAPSSAVIAVTVSAVGLRTRTQRGVLRSTHARWLPTPPKRVRPGMRVTESDTSGRGGAVVGASRLSGDEKAPQSRIAGSETCKHRARRGRRRGFIAHDGRVTGRREMRALTHLLVMLQTTNGTQTC